MGLHESENFRHGLIRRIARTAANQNGGDERCHLLEREVKRYLFNPNVQRAALAQMWRSELGTRQFNRQRAKLLEQNFAPYRLGRCNHAKVKWRRRPKPSGGFRKICDFPSGLKVHHLLAKDIVQAVSNVRPHIGEWKGRGRDWQVAQIKAAINSPSQYVVYADVTSCFATTNFDHVYDLRTLPETFVRRALDYRCMSFRQIDEGSNRTTVSHWGSVAEQDTHEAPPRNLLEGSPVSSALWAVMIDDLPDHLPDGIKLFVYCDNIVIIAPSYSAAQQSQVALVDYFRRHCAGPFELRNEVHPVTEQFSHLGYDIWLSRQDELWVQPTNNNIGKLIRRTASDQYSPTQNARWLRSSFGQMTENARRTFIEALAPHTQTSDD